MTTRTSFQPLFESKSISSRTLANRVWVAPMTRVSANADGTASDTMTKYYERYAKGGFSAVVTEGSYIDTEWSQTYLHQPGLVTSAHIEAWKSVVNAIHSHGALAIAQLQHSGPQGQGNIHRTEVKSPSDIPARGSQLTMYRGSGPYQVPESLTFQEMGRIADHFVTAAQNAIAAGFDGVEIHGANGYLLDAFNTAYLNQRNDEYGGSPENRIRFTAEVVSRVKAALGGTGITGVRISQNKVSDATYKWPGGTSEANIVFAALEDAGAEYIHISEPSALSSAFPDEHSETLINIARQCAPNTVLIVNGAINTPAEAVQALTEERADFVALGKAALANPDWVRRVQDGRKVEPPLYPSEFGELATIQSWEIDQESAAAANSSAFSR